MKSRISELVAAYKEKRVAKLMDNDPELVEATNELCRKAVTRYIGPECALCEREIVPGELVQLEDVVEWHPGFEYQDRRYPVLVCSGCYRSRSISDS